VLSKGGTKEGKTVIFSSKVGPVKGVKSFGRGNEWGGAGGGTEGVDLGENSSS